MNLTNILIICNKDIEIERYNNMEKQIKNSDIDKNEFEYFCFCWMDDIQSKRKNEEDIYGLKFNNLNNAEISLFINHIEVLKKIKNEYSEGKFLILESDVFFFPDLEFNQKKLNEIVEESKNLNDWDIINIGGSCYDFLGHGYPKGKCIKLNRLNFYIEKRLIGIEALIWNYNSICKFLNLFENDIKNNNTICHPIDCYLDILITNNKLNIFWLQPYLLKQLSGPKNTNAHFDSWIR